MNGFLLLIPFFLIRFGLLSFLNKQALPRAAHFAPMRGREKAARLLCVPADDRRDRAVSVVSFY